MAKKIPRKEEEFWRDLAGRMAKHLGYSIKEKRRRARPNCCRKKAKVECLVIDKTTFFGQLLQCMLSVGKML